MQTLGLQGKDVWWFLLGGGTAFIAIVLVPIVLGRLILGPINQVAGRLKAPTRFQLSDFFWLVVQFQFVVGYCVRFVGSSHIEYFLLNLSFLTGAAMGLWAGAVSYMSRAGVASPPRRALFILVILPATLGTMMASSFASLLGMLMLQGAVTDAYREDLYWMLRTASIDRDRAIVGLVLLPFVVYGLRRAGVWIVSSSQRPVKSGPVEPAIEGSSHAAA